MSVGAGQYVLIELWNGDTLLHSGVLEPGGDFYGKFPGGALSVDSFVLKRLTRVEVEELSTDSRFGPVAVTPLSQIARRLHS